MGVSKTHPPMPTLKDSYTLWANQMAVSTPSSPPQQNSVFGQGSDMSLRSTFGIRKKRDKRASVSSITSPTRSMSVRRTASTSNGSMVFQSGSTNGTNGTLHPSPPKRNASLHISKVKSASDDNTVNGTYPPGHPTHSTTHARVPSNSSFNFTPHSRTPSDVFAPDHISLHQKTESMSSNDLEQLEQLVQPDLSMPEKATASLDQLYNMLAERTVQLSHNSYQNTQLWAMVNKQRQMILDLQRDLDSSLEVNARYKRRLLRATGDNATANSNANNASNPSLITTPATPTATNSTSTGNSIPGNAASATNGGGSTTTVVPATAATPAVSSSSLPPPTSDDNNSTTAISAKSAVSSTPSPNGSTSSVATSINNNSAGSNNGGAAASKNIPQPIVPLPYPLPAISSAREPKGFSFEEDRDNANSKTHRKTKSDTLNDDSFLVPEKSPSRDPRLRTKKSMASVTSQDDSSTGNTLGAVSMSKSASMGATAAAPSTPSLPPPALAPEPVTLYVKPTELSTIRVDVASSLGVARKKDTPVVVLSVSDRATCKELWRCSKEYSAFVALDNAISPQIPSFKTKIPDRSLFTSHAPARVDIRKDQLNGWFGSLLAIPRLPSPAAQTLCEFLSTNTMDPLDVPDGDARKEGFLTKRGKSFGGWKLRYFVLDGPMLNYYESPNGPHLGAIRLYNARIGRQTQEEDSNSEDAYRHAFLVMEPRKKDYVRHVLCAENDRERDDWIEALLEFVTLPEPDSPVKSIHSPAITTVSTNNTTLNAYQDSIYDEYSEAPTPTLPTTEAIDSVMESQKGTGLGIDVGSSETVGSGSGLGSSTINAAPIAGSGVASSSSNSRISAPIASEPIQNLQKWGYKYSPSSQSLNAQLQGDGDDHGGLFPNHNHTPIQAPIPEVKEKKKFFLFRKGNSDRQQQQQQQHTSTPEYLQSVLEAEGMIQREERPTTPSLTTPTQSQFDSNDYHQSGVFGVPLLQAIESSSKDIDGHVVPSVVWRCIQYLDDQKAHFEEGIFRLSGSASAIRILKARFNDHYDIDLVSDSSTVFDVHAVAGLLKLFLREMPSLILTQQLSPAFRRAMEIPDIVARIYELKTLVTQLPAESRDLLFVLAQYLCKIIDNQDYNKMNLRNVGIVFSPTVNVPAGIFVLFLTDFDCIFGDAQPRTDINRKLQDFPQALLG